MLDLRPQCHDTGRMEDPIRVGRGVEIPLREILIRASRSSGPGGQHANTTASRIEAVFDVAASAALSEEQKRRIISRSGPRVVAVAQDTRNQAQNRELALRRLRDRLESALRVSRPRAATRPTKSSVRRRMEAKLRQSERKRQRRAPGSDEA
jgi:ribosome-associated protein